MNTKDNMQHDTENDKQYSIMDNKQYYIHDQISYKMPYNALNEELNKASNNALNEELSKASSKELNEELSKASNKALNEELSKASSKELNEKLSKVSNKALNEELNKPSNKKSNKEAVLRNVCYVIFLLYAVLVIKLIMFKYISLISFIEKIITGSTGGFRSVNLIPFKSIIEYTIKLFKGYFTIAFNNLAGNILIFVPFGYFMPLLFKSFRKINAVVFSSLIISLLFEVCQYFLYLGSADVDDIILNTAGGAAGYLIYRLVVKCTNVRHKNRSITTIYSMTIALSAAGFAAAAVIAMDYFEMIF